MMEWAHGTVVALGEAGVLIQGTSGSGKTSLGQALVADAKASARFGRVVGDDRVALREAHGRLVARPHPAIAGRMEWRGFGIRSGLFEPACVISLVVRLVTGAEIPPERCPDGAPRTRLLGVNLPMLMLMSNSSARDNSGRVFALLFA